MNCTGCIAYMTLRQAQQAQYTTWSVDTYAHAQRDMAAAVQLCRELRGENQCRAVCNTTAALKLSNPTQEKNL